MFERAMDDCEYVVRRPVQAGPKAVCKALVRRAWALEDPGRAGRVEGVEPEED